MRYRLWQRAKPLQIADDLDDFSHTLLFEWHFWTLKEAQVHANYCKHTLTGCLGEFNTYYQIYDTCTYTYYAGEGFSDQNEKQRREDPLGVSASAQTRACLCEVVLPYNGTESS